MTTKSELQTLLAYVEELRHTRDDLEQFAFYLDGIEVLNDDLRRGDDHTNPNAKTQRQRMERDAFRHEMIDRLVQEAREARQKIEDGITHIMAYKAAPFIEELIEIEEKKLAKEKATELINSNH